MQGAHGKRERKITSEREITSVKVNDFAIRSLLCPPQIDNLFVLHLMMEESDV